MSAPENPKQTKNPITLKIKFKSSSLEQFIERYSVDVSKSGIFIRTKEPLAVGTQLRFEFQLQDGNALLSGEGTVVWNRALDPSRSSVAPGMGVRFDKLSADSQKILERILGEKTRRGDSNTESRFDAGVRALREGAATEASLTSQTTPKADTGFGDEPTRAVPADQVAKLAAETADDDPPTRQVPSDLTEEVRRAMGAAADSHRQLTPITAPPPGGTPGGPPANLGRTLLGQGFMMGPRSPSQNGGRDAASVPGTGLRDAPSVEVIRKETSQQLAAPGGGKGDSAKTPTAPVDEQRARIADSHRTPTGQTPSAQQAVKSSDPISRPGESVVRTPEPAAKPPEPLSRPLESLSKPAELASFASANTATRKSGTSTGLIIGVVALLAIVGALVYVFVFGKTYPNAKNQLPPGTTTGTGGTGDAVRPTTPDPNKPNGTAPVTELKPELVKQPEPTAVPVKPTESTDGVEITTEPVGVKVEFGGKTYGPTPTHVPGLAVGSQISLSLRGYQEAKIRLRTAPDEAKPLFFKLTPIERVVEVNSTPKGADVLVDGKKVGKTPFMLKKLDTAKVHQVELRRAGFAPWTHNVSDTESFVVKNRKEVLTLNATLEATDDGTKKPAHGPKKEPAAPGGETTAPGGAVAPPPTELPKAPDPTPAPEPAKEKEAAPAPAP